MRIWLHMGGVIAFGFLFVLSKLMSEGHVEWAAFLWRIPLPAQHLSKAFLYSGKIFEALAIVGAFLEMVVVMILAGGWVIDLLVSLSSGS
jgi:hypothetical protein